MEFSDTGSPTNGPAFPSPPLTLPTSKATGTTAPFASLGHVLKPHRSTRTRTTSTPPCYSPLFFSTVPTSPPEMGSAVSQADFQAYVARLPGTKSLHLLRSRCTLNDILSGTTCPPISVTDFELYLAHQELSMENLHFAVWFLDYQDRFSKLPLEARQLSPDPFPANVASGAVDHPQRPKGWLSKVFKKPRPPSSLGLSPASTAVEYPHPLSPISPPATESSPFLPGPSADPANVKDQPFRDETLRVVATFLRGSKEIALDQKLRDEVLKNLAVTTHPNVFKKVYQKVYEQLEMSVHNFVDVQSTNINRPKQNYWYTIGLTFTAISLVMAAILIVFYPLHTKHPPYTYQPLRRAVRLASLPFATAGAMVTYSAWRGFCSEVFSRRATQLKTWEMEDIGTAGVVLRKIKAKTEDPGKPPNTADSKKAIAPFAFDNPSTHSLRRGSASSLDSITAKLATQAPGLPAATHEIAFVRPEKESPSSPGYKKPPVFGPERIVQDERIRQFHLDVLNDILWFGVWYALVFAIVVAAVPGMPPPRLLA